MLYRESQLMHMTNIFLLPNSSPRRPPMRMNVPIVKLYPAINHDNVPGLLILKESPIMDSVVRVLHKPSWLMNMDMHTLAMNRIRRGNEKASAG